MYKYIAIVDLGHAGFTLWEYRTKSDMKKSLEVSDSDRIKQILFAGTRQQLLNTFKE